MATKTSDWRPGPTVCRCCLSEGCYKDISTEYFWMGKREVYAEMLSDTLNLTIAYSKSGPNSNSRLICEPCISRLRDAHDFRRQVVECEKTFMQHLDPGSSILQKELEMNLEEVKVEQVKQEKKASDDEDFDDRIDFVVDNDDTDDDLDDEPLMKLATKVPKKEKEVDLLDLLDNSQVTVKRKSTASSSKAKEPPAKKAKKQIVIKPSASKATASASKPGEKKKKGKPATPQASKKDEGPRTSAWIITAPERENAATFLQYTTVVPFVLFHGNYKCFYCEETFTELHPVLQHTKTHAVPNRSSLLSKYVKNGRKIVVKVDISGLKCRICELKYSKLDDIRAHLITAHKKVFNKAGNGLMAYNLSIPNGNVACHICDMEFSSFFNLNRHMNVHDNLVCETCGLGFMTHHRLRTHRVIHENGSHKCDQCSKIFTTKLKLRYHIDKFHKEASEMKMKRQKCPHCLERFSGHYRKLTHMREVHGVTFKFECQTCKAEFPTKLALTQHTTKIHIQNVVCKVCGKCFATPSRLKIHARGHTGERNFICAICQKAYMHERELRRHMKTHGYKFTCFKCGNGFLEKAELSEHKKREHA